MPPEKMEEAVEGGGGEEQTVGGEEDEDKINGGDGNVSDRVTVKRIAGDELIGGWPKWLVDNIPTEALVGLVPRSVDSYEKLSKVENHQIFNDNFIILSLFGSCVLLKLLLRKFLAVWFRFLK